MAGMAATYLNALGAHGRTLITHIGLVDETGTELTGGEPAYARQAVTWTESGAGSGGEDDDGEIRPTTDLEFDVPASTTVGGWRGFSALNDGTNYGGKDLTQEAFAAQGEYKLLAAGTSINHNADAGE